MTSVNFYTATAAVFQGGHVMTETLLADNLTAALGAFQMAHNHPQRPDPIIAVAPERY